MRGVWSGVARTHSNDAYAGGPAPAKGHENRTRSFGASSSGAFAAGAMPSNDGCCAAGDGAAVEGSGASTSSGRGTASGERNV